MTSKRRRKVTPFYGLDREIDDVNGKYCLIEGTFDFKDKGHLGLYNGSIRNISRLKTWVNRPEQNVKR